MDLRTKFELFIQQHIPNADISRDQEDSDYYMDGAVQAAWVGFRSLHRAVSEDSTNSTDNNHDNWENTE